MTGESKRRRGQRSIDLQVYAYLCTHVERPDTTAIHLRDGASHTMEVRLRTDEVVRGARTTVETLNDDPELPISRFDPDLRNNRAQIVVDRPDDGR